MDKRVNDMTPEELVHYLESRGFAVSESDTIAELREAVCLDLKIID